MIMHKKSKINVQKQNSLLSKLMEAEKEKHEN